MLTLATIEVGAIVVVTAVLIVILLRLSRSGALALGIESCVQRETERVDRALRDEASRIRAEIAALLTGLLENRLTSLDQAQDARLAGVRQELDRTTTTLSTAVDRTGELTVSRVGAVLEKNEVSFGAFGRQLVEFESRLDSRLETVRSTVDTKLAQIQEDNARKLDAMRNTVEEKLQSTLERRLGESFALVSHQLEQVQRGLGEMQSLTEDVGDLRRVMTNVKARGVLGEWRLEAVLDQLMAPDQYEKNVQTVPGSGATVEFAIRMPQRGDASWVLWLPVDSKFPIEDYERLIAAQDVADKEGVDAARRELAATIKRAAKDIHTKYVEPPHTTEYAILFIPTEGLFAEVVRYPGLVEEIHRDYHVTIAGPTTFATLLNCIQMGFRSVAVAERSKEVWKLLGAVRSEFGKFTDAMSAVKKKLEQARTAIESVETRTRVMGRKLNSVDELPACEAQRLLGAAESEESWMDHDGDVSSNAAA